MNTKTKEIRAKIANVLSYIYGTGIMIALFVGALSFLGYLVAIIIGGDVATDICVFIYKKIYPILITFSSCVVLLGLIKMYVAGEKSLAPKKKNKVESTENEAKAEEASDTVDSEPTEN